MLEGGTHGTLLCSDGNFEAISGCRAPFCAPHQKRGSTVGLPVGWGLRGLFFDLCTLRIHGARSNDYQMQVSDLISDLWLTRCSDRPSSHPPICPPPRLLGQRSTAQRCSSPLPAAANGSWRRRQRRRRRRRRRRPGAAPGRRRRCKAARPQLRVSFISATCAPRADRRSLPACRSRPCSPLAPLLRALSLLPAHAPARRLAPARRSLPAHRLAPARRSLSLLTALWPCPLLSPRSPLLAVLAALAPARSLCMRSCRARAQPGPA